MRIEIMKMDSCTESQTTVVNRSAPAQIPINRNTKLVNELFVGLDRDAELIRDKLVEDRKKVDVVFIVGMGGIGKTTLATKVFNDPFVVYHFHARVWVTVSQSYDKRAVLIQILASIGVKLDIEKASESRLRELVHKNLMDKRYLIVIDDIWHIETWDNLKLFFPHCNNGSRILLTSRVTEVARHANSDGLIHHLGYLNKETSWELLCEKVFHGNECPEWSIELGMKIVENCQGLPLAMVVIAGVLAKEAWSEKFWVEIAERTGSYLVDEENGCLETLGLSYDHLPLHLRECFLYLGGFPEDYMFDVQRLIWLWVAEGFIQEDGNKSLEDIAEGYLMDLIDRNLVTVARESMWLNGDVEACKVHDLVRELCLKKAKEERFIIQTNKQDSALLILSSDVIAPPVVRMFINDDINILGTPHQSPRDLRSVLCFSYHASLNYEIAESLCSFVLLRVLDLETCGIDYFSEDMKLLAHLRYLAINAPRTGFPSLICNLWSLQTLLYFTYERSICLPSNISNLVNLRHLWSDCTMYHPSIGKPMNLQTISDVWFQDGVGDFQKWFPCINKLTCTSYLDEENDIKSLPYLKKFNLTARPKGEPSCGNITFPSTLKTLTLELCRLAWSDMSIIQSLPKLQVLKLHYNAFEGSCWNTDGQEFRQLKFLRLEELNIELWEVNGTSFPCLIRLEINGCDNLEEIPFEIGDIPTLELIKVDMCSQSVNESVRRIQEEQQTMGNYDLKIHIRENRRRPCRWDR